MKIMVIIPCYNEELTIGSVIDSLASLDLDLSITVIDNNSTDKTAQVALSRGVTVIHESRQGKGFAFRSAVAKIDADIFFMTDGDTTYDLSMLSEAINLMASSGADMIIGVRRVNPEAQNKMEYRRGHVLGNKILSKIFHVLFGLQLKDSLSGWRLMSRPYLKSFSYATSGFELEVDLNVHAALLQSDIREIEVVYNSRPAGSNSKLNTYRDGWKILKRNFKLFTDSRPGLAFGIFSIPWAIASVGLISIAVKEFSQTGKVLHFPSLIVGIGAFIIAVFLIIAGLILDRVAGVRSLQVRQAYIEYSSREHSSG